MRLIRTAVAVSSLLALGLTAACSTSTESADPEETAAVETAPAETDGESTEEPMAEGDIPMGDGTQTIYLVSKGFQHRFWQAVNEGAQQAGDEFGYKVEFVGPDNEQQVTQQLDMLKTALNSKPAAIGFAALDSGAASTVLSDIEAANIPIIAFDSGVESDIPLTTVQTDNRAAAAATMPVRLRRLFRAPSTRPSGERSAGTMRRRLSESSGSLLSFMVSPLVRRDGPSRAKLRSRGGSGI